MTELLTLPDADGVSHAIYPPHDNVSLGEATHLLANGSNDELLSRYGPIADWDVSNVTNMCEIFKDCGNFNGDLSKWDVSNV